MGASASVSNIALKKHNYISYADQDVCGEIIHSELIKFDTNIIQGHSQIVSDYNLKIDGFSSYVKDIMTHSNYIIICISEKTVNDVYQRIEIDHALDSNKTLFYIFTDEMFTPLNTPYLNELVGHNRWVPGYDESTINNTVDELLIIIRSEDSDSSI